MGSDYYAYIAGEIADEGSAAEAAFLEWLNEYTRHEAEPGRTTWDELRAAFMAGRATWPGKTTAYRNAALTALNDPRALATCIAVALNAAGYSVIPTAELERHQEAVAQCSDGLAAAVNAETKRIAELATESGATCIAQGDVEIPFADLIGRKTS